MAFPFSRNGNQKTVQKTLVNKNFSKERQPQLKLANVSSAQTAAAATHDDVRDLHANHGHFEQYPQEIRLDAEEMDDVKVVVPYPESVESMATGSTLSTIKAGDEPDHDLVAPGVDHLSPHSLTTRILDLHTRVNKAVPTYTGDITAWLDNATPRYSGPAVVDRSSMARWKKGAATHMSDVSSDFVYVVGPGVVHDFKDVGAWSGLSQDVVYHYSKQVHID